MSKRDMNGRKTLSMLMGAGIVLIAGVGGAMAGGGFSEPSYSQDNGSAVQKDGRGSTGSSSYGDIEYSGNGVEYTGAAGAEAEAFVRNGVRGASVSVGSGANTELQGEGVIDQTSESKMISYSKNGGVIAKGRSETVTTVKTGGQEILVVDEVAKAAARATPFGSSSATSVEQNVYSDSNGYTGNVTTDKTIRTK